MFWIVDRTISGCYKKQNNREQLSVKAYCHKTVPVIVDNIITTLNRIQVQEIEDDEEMEL